MDYSQEHGPVGSALEAPGRTCERCRAAIGAGQEYLYNSKCYCEDCLITIRNPRVRKTHWQYLKTIKTQYLQPGSQD